jgi:biotin transport system substrate-specific component
MSTKTLQTAGSRQAARLASSDSTLTWIRIAGVVGFALATAASAAIAIPLPGTPVPMTLQTLIVLLAGVTLGPRLGLVSMAFYLLLGTTGYHVFAAGNWGLSTVFGATGGYLIGFVLAQPVIGAMTRAPVRTWSQLLPALLLGNAIIFGCGLSWLALWSGGGVQQALAWGLWPFVPGLLLKTGLALGVGQLTLRRFRRLFDSHASS